MSTVVNSFDQLMEFLGNLIKLLRWEKLPNLQPFIEGDEPKRIAAEFEKFAANGFRLVQNIVSLGTVTVDRIKPFKPSKSFGKGWTIWKGPADGGGLIGNEEQDAQALMLTQVNVSDLIFETALLDEESEVGGEEKLRRLRESGRILLDVAFGKSLLEEPNHLTLEMLRISRGIQSLDFPGTVVRDWKGSRRVFRIYWSSQRGKEAFWSGHFTELNSSQNVYNYSVLK